jgi:hypothetical protein
MQDAQLTAVTTLAQEYSGVDSVARKLSSSAASAAQSLHIRDTAIVLLHECPRKQGGQGCKWPTHAHEAPRLPSNHTTRVPFSQARSSAVRQAPRAIDRLCAIFGNECTRAPGLCRRLLMIHVCCMRGQSGLKTGWQHQRLAN